MEFTEKGVRVLVAEDRDEDFNRIGDLLSASPATHYHVDRVATYDEAVARLRRNEHDVCLLAYQPGSGGGSAVLQALARFGVRVPIIAVTDPGDRETAVAAIDAGAVDTLDLGDLSADVLDRAIRYAGQRRRMEDALRAGQERLIEADLRRDDLLAMLAHELRNRMASIRFALQGLRLESPEDAQLRRPRDLIDRQVTQMARLLNDLLDVSRMAHGKVHLQKDTLNLQEAVDQAVEAARPLIEEHRHELVYARLAEPLWIEGDAGRLEQVFRHLLQNAVKFTKAGGRIWVSVEHGGPTQAEMATVRVTDNGLGIEPEMLPRVFDLFTQIDQSLNRAQGGLGIGLTMVKQLVRMHGGAVEAHSDGPGKGSEFIVHLPLLNSVEVKAAKPPPARQEEAAPRPQKPPAKPHVRRVLVVDDNMDSANTLAELIEHWGHETRVVHDGAAALEAASDFHPDVVLLDIGLPGMNGYQVARHLRSRPGLKEATLIALTGYGQDEDRRLAELSGFDRHITKPIELDALQSLLTDAA